MSRCLKLSPHGSFWKPSRVISSVGWCGKFGIQRRALDKSMWIYDSWTPFWLGKVTFVFRPKIGGGVTKWLRHARSRGLRIQSFFVILLTIHSPKNIITFLVTMHTNNPFHQKPHCLSDSAGWPCYYQINSTTNFIASTVTLLSIHKRHSPHYYVFSYIFYSWYTDSCFITALGN